MTQQQAATRDALNDLISLASKETIQRAEERAALPPPRPARFTRDRACLGALVVAAPILAIVVVTNVLGYSLVGLITPTPTPEVARHEAQRTLDEIVRGIESFREDYAELPERLVEVGIPAKGRWIYLRKLDGRYQVAGDLYGEVVRFDSPFPKPGPDGQQP